MTPRELLAEYTNRHVNILCPLAKNLESHLQDCLKELERIDRIAVRAKSPSRFIAKATKILPDGESKYRDPFGQIQDLIGGRIIVFYRQDVDTITNTILKYFSPIENRDMIPERESEFGYFGKHFVLSFPEDLFEDNVDRSRIPSFFELQVKTLFQHAWSEAGHDLAYKPNAELTKLQKRIVALTAAQAWGADQQFARLNTELNGAPQHEGE